MQGLAAAQRNDLLIEQFCTDADRSTGKMAKSATGRSAHGEAFGNRKQKSERKK